MSAIPNAKKEVEMYRALFIEATKTFHNLHHNKNLYIHQCDIQCCDEAVRAMRGTDQSEWTLQRADRIIERLATEIAEGK